MSTRIGVVGTGYISRFHFKAFQTLGAKVVRVADRRRDLAGEIGGNPFKGMGRARLACRAGEGRGDLLDAWPDAAVQHKTRVSAGCQMRDRLADGLLEVAVIAVDRDGRLYVAADLNAGDAQRHQIGYDATAREVGQNHAIDAAIKHGSGVGEPTGVESPVGEETVVAAGIALDLHGAQNLVQIMAVPGIASDRVGRGARGDQSDDAALAPHQTLRRTVRYIAQSPGDLANALLLLLGDADVAHPVGQHPGHQRDRNFRLLCNIRLQNHKVTF